MTRRCGRSSTNPQDPLTPFRELERGEVFREYVRKLLERLPKTHRDSRKLALMPAIADQETRKRYKGALEAAIPGVTVVPEPEMVAEYFRLLQRTLKLEKGENNVFLVVDVGASTANMTVILSRRDEKIVEIDARGAQRHLRVRALRGDSVCNAGRWVDHKLVEMLRVPDSLLASERLVLCAVERAKVRCSQTGVPAEVSLPSPNHQLIVDSKMLVALSKALWCELVPLFENLCERLFENQTSSKDAKRKSEARFAQRKVNGPKDAHRLIDAILLSGGTTLLPGFQDTMLEALFGAGHQPAVFRTGNAFPVAAAAGGLAHVLRTYDPPRLKPAQDGSDESFDAGFESTLPYPLVLGIKKVAEREHQSVILDPDDPFIDDGGRRTIEGLPVLVTGSRPRMRLIPGGAAGVSARRGRHFRAMQVRQSPVRMDLDWDPDRQRATIHSDAVEDAASTLWIDAHMLRKRQEEPQQPFEGVHGTGDDKRDAKPYTVEHYRRTLGWAVDGRVIRCHPMGAFVLFPPPASAWTAFELLPGVRDCTLLCPSSRGGSAEQRLTNLLTAVVPDVPWQEAPAS